MQHGMVDIVIVGADRVTANGDVANKIGTYLKALAAQDSGIPLYVALPSSTVDWTLRDGVREIPIETRNENEVRKIDGLLPTGVLGEVLICPQKTNAANYGFDVTPNRLITGLILETGVVDASEQGLLKIRK
jgi:methylthioribose-1-phosphate isomerase